VRYPGDRWSATGEARPSTGQTATRSQTVTRSQPAALGRRRIMPPPELQATTKYRLRAVRLGEANRCRKSEDRARRLSALRPLSRVAARGKPPGVASPSSMRSAWSSSGWISVRVDVQSARLPLTGSIPQSLAHASSRNAEALGRLKGSTQLARAARLCATGGVRARDTSQSGSARHGGRAWMSESPMNPGRFAPRGPVLPGGLN
jgi:hypothetical protein